MCCEASPTENRVVRRGSTRTSLKSTPSLASPTHPYPNIHLHHETSPVSYQIHHKERNIQTLLTSYSHRLTLRDCIPISVRNNLLPYLRGWGIQDTTLKLSKLKVPSPPHFDRVLVFVSASIHVFPVCFRITTIRALGFLRLAYSKLPSRSLGR